MLNIRGFLVISKAARRYAVGAAAITLISACGSEGKSSSQTNNENTKPLIAGGEVSSATAIGAASPTVDVDTTAEFFTALKLDDGYWMLDWHADPQAMAYVVLVDGQVVAEITSADKNSVTIHSDANLEYSSIQVFSRTADDVLNSWVVDHQLIIVSRIPSTETGVHTIAQSAGSGDTSGSPTNSENTEEVLAGREAIDTPAIGAAVPTVEVDASERPSVETGENTIAQNTGLEATSSSPSNIENIEDVFAAEEATDTPATEGASPAMDIDTSETLSTETGENTSGQDTDSEDTSSSPTNNENNKEAEADGEAKDTPTTEATNQTADIDANNRFFTALELNDGSWLLEWHADPQAVAYIVLVDGDILAEIASTDQSSVLIQRDVDLANSSIQVFSKTTDNILSSWVEDPQLIIASETASTETDENTGVQDTGSGDTSGSPTDNENTENVVAGGEALEDQAQEDQTPEAEVQLVQPQPNSAPFISSTSHDCDPVIEAAYFSIGESNNFTLSVNDESPLTLSYAADSSRSDIVSVTVDANGVFTLSAVATGESYLWLTAEDDHGLVDEYELLVVVE